MTNEGASVKEQRFFVKMDGPMKHSSFRGNNLVIIFLDDYTRFMVVKFVEAIGTATSLFRLQITSPHRSYRSSVYRRILSTSSKGNFSANWTV